MADLLARGRADREAGRLEEALAGFQEASKLDSKNNVLQRELSHTRKEIARRKAEEVARRKAEEKADTVEERAKVEKELLERAATYAEAGAERRRADAVALGGERRLKAGQVDEDDLVVLSVTPKELHDRLGRIVAAALGASSAEDGLSQMPGALTYARSREDLHRMAEAARAAEAALEDEILVPDEAETGLELEPALEPQPPMPDLEEQLDAEAEILEAMPVEDLDDADVIEGEVLEVEPERMAAVPITDAEFAAIEKDLEPDPVQEWCETYAAAGRAPAVLEDD